MADSSRNHYLATAATVADLVAGIENGWERPGLGEWTLRALTGHTSRALVTVLNYLDRPAPRIDRETAADYYIALTSTPVTDPGAVTARGVTAGEALGSRPAEGFSLLVDQVTEKLGRFPDDAVIETIAGGMRVDAYLATRTFELVVHGFDIAHAVGVQFVPPVEAVADMCALAGRVAALTGRGEALLMSLTGRRRLAADFSVV